MQLHSKMYVTEYKDFNPQTHIQKTYVNQNLESIWPQNLLEPY